MTPILIAYNDDTAVDLHDFFESCGDDVRQYCYDNGIAYSSLVPPDLTEENVMSSMDNHQICFIASHGDTDGIYNELDKDVISIRTTNYNLKDKVLYSVACHSATNLRPRLMQIGLKLFVGYNNVLKVRGEHPPFLKSALYGLKCLLQGDDANTARSKMNQVFDEQIEELKKQDVWAATFLLHDKESLVFEENDNSCV